MAVLNREDFLNRVKNHFGETPNDEQLSVMEDIIDTYNDMESRSGEDEWKRKYDELDASWRKRYRDRFFTPIPDSSNDEEAYLKDKSNEDVSIEMTEPEEKLKDYEDLFY